jgi:hypothetical protein
MWTRILLASIPLLAGQASAQTRSEQPGPIQLGGVRSAAPRPMQQLGGTRASVPFTRMGPTARTIGDGNTQPQYRPIRDQYRPTHRTDYQPIHRSRGTLTSEPSTPGNVSQPRDTRHPRERFVDRIREVRGRGGPFTDFDDFDRNGGFHVIRRPRTGVITTGSGLSVNGSFEDDNFRLGFHIGGPLVHFPGDGCRDGHHHHDHGQKVVGYPWGFAYPWGYSGGSYYGYGYDTVYGSYAAYDPALYHAPVQLPPAPVTIDTPPATEKERGDTLLEAGAFKQAITAYKAHLNDNPGDAGAMRSLGMALIADSQLQDGVAMVAMAYKADPALASEPVQGALLSGAGGVRAMVERVSVFANRVKLPSAWLTLAALMQAEGRNQLAGRMIDRARQAGLEAGLAAQMQAALKS